MPAIAFSLATRKTFDFTARRPLRAAALAAAALARPLPARDAPERQHPGGRGPRAIAVTRLGKHSYGFDVIEKVDPRGRKYYWIGGNEYQFEETPGTDCNAVLKDGLVSVTPLHLDLTDEDTKAEVAGWTIEGFAPS